MALFVILFPVLGVINVFFVKQFFPKISVFTIILILNTLECVTTKVPFDQLLKPFLIPL